MTNVAAPVSLQRRAFQGLAQFLIALALTLFLPAWSLRYWQVWVYWTEFSLLVTWISIYFLKNNPALIERRLKAGPGAETEKIQKVIQTFTSLCFMALIIFPGLDHHWGWSRVPPWMVLTGNVLVALGLIIIFFVFKENSYTSGIIEVAQNQTVISTGPYRVVRHPMYAGATLMMLGTPVALGSLWGLLFCIPMLGLLMWRAVNEEMYLSQNLPGYTEYRMQTRYRLIPGVF